MASSSEPTTLAARRASESLFRQLAENLREVFWMTDTGADANASNTELLYVSARYAEVFGRSSQSLHEAPDSWLDAVHHSDRARVRESLRTQREALAEATYRILRPDGSERWIRHRSFPLRDEDGGDRRVVAIAEDVTPLVHAEERLRHAEKLEAVGQLTGGVAHDFNNLLSVILSYVEILLNGVDARDPAREALEEVRKAGERASDLTRQLLAFSRKQVLMARPLDLRDTVQGMAKMLRRVLTEDVEIVVANPSSLGSVHADPGQVEQMILNLAINAGDAMPRGGTLTIKTLNVHLGREDAAELGGAPGPYVTLVVEDDGIGMNAETRARVFEPFFTTKAVGKGTGLGLSSVFGAVQQSGGMIRVDSAPGDGARFSIYLPRVAEDAITHAEAPARASTAPGTETVLVVEDQEQVRVVARNILRRIGYDVLEASNAGEALLVCEQHETPIHLLVTDVVMPRMSGPSLAKRLALLRPDMRVLFMSGYARDSLDVELAFIQKPIRPESLARRVREVLDAPIAPRPKRGTSA